MADSALLARRAPGVNTLSGLGPRRGTPRQGGRRRARSGWRVFSHRAALSVRGKDRLGYSRPNSRLARRENSCHHGSSGFSDRLLMRWFGFSFFQAGRSLSLSRPDVGGDLRAPGLTCSLTACLGPSGSSLSRSYRKRKLAASCGW
jgi:hypothetical protein